MREGLEQRKEEQGSKQTPGHEHGLTANPIRQFAENHVERCRDNSRGDDEKVRGTAIYLERLGKEEHGVELACVPHDGLAHYHPKKRQQDDTEVLPLPEGFRNWCFRRRAFPLHPLELGRLMKRQADSQGNEQQQEGEQKRNAPAPCGERLLA
ncbi:hypothetical protein D3C86_1016480 [compost metagenome]